MAEQVKAVGSARMGRVLLLIVEVRFPAEKVLNATLAPVEAGAAMKRLNRGIS
jgi:hypothetical protein